MGKQDEEMGARNWKAYSEKSEAAISRLRADCIADELVVRIGGEKSDVSCLMCEAERRVWGE